MRKNPERNSLDRRMKRDFFSISEGLRKAVPRYYPVFRGAFHIRTKVRKIYHDISQLPRVEHCYGNLQATFAGMFHLNFGDAQCTRY